MVNRFLRGLGDLASIMGTIATAAAQYGLDPNFVAAIARRESNLNPNAVSSAGAKGIMQLMDATAAMLGVTNPFDPVQNINAGVKYLAQLLNQFSGDVAKALAAYNWGPGAVAKAVQQWGDQWLAHAPAETQAYVQALAGVTAPPPASDTTPPLTIDAGTGQVVPDTTATPAIPSWMPATPQGKILLLTAAAFGVYLLSDSLWGE